MHNNERASARENIIAALIANASADERCNAHGVYHAVLLDPDGNVKWEDYFLNVVTTVGKNLALDTYLAGAAYTVTGPFLGLISSVSYTTGPVAGDTMASHGGWTEAGNANAPAYSGTRKTAVWSAAAAGAKSLSAALSFVFTSGGTVKGAFLAFGAGAVNTIDSAAGTLYSAGLFSGGDKIVSTADQLNVSYTASL